MAILDRPMFRRPLTKDQLRGYGLPAFANGGIVQKFQTGGKVDLGYTESGAISDKPIFNPFKGLSLEDYNRMSPQEVLNFYQEVDQTRIPGKIKGAESVDRLYNILRKEGPDLPGFMEAIRKPQMTEPYADAFKFTDSPALAQSDEELMKQKEEYQVSQAQKSVDSIQDGIEYQQKVIEQKKKQGFSTEEEEAKIAELQAEKEKEEAKVSAIKSKFFKEDGALDSTKKLEAEQKKDTTVDTTDTKDTGDDTSTTKEEPDPVKERSDMERLRELAKERSALYKEIVGDPEKMRRQQGFLQLAQFGLNLASARGGNLAEKIATSAKDPLQTFAALAREAAQDERAIEVAALEGAERELALEKELKAKADKEYQFQSGVEFISRAKNIPESEAIDMYLGLESETQKGLSAFTDNLEQQDRSDDFLSAAQATGWVTESAMEDTDNYVVDGELKIENISSPGNKVFYNLEDGKKVAYKIKDSALTKEEPLTSEDFVRLPGVKVIPGT